MADVIRLTDEEFEEFLFGDNGYSVKSLEKILDKRRWAVRTSQIFSKDEDGTLWEVIWDDPATEMQEGQGYNAIMREVEEVTEMVKVIKYVPKK